MPFTPDGTKGCWVRYYATTLPVEYPEGRDTDREKCIHMWDVMEYFGADKYLLDRTPEEDRVKLFSFLVTLDDQKVIQMGTQLIEDQKVMHPWCCTLESVHERIGRMWFTNERDAAYMRLIVG